jgi:hypothetical protein
MFFICLEAISWMPGKEVAVWLITDFLPIEGTEESGAGARWVTDYL